MKQIKVNGRINHVSKFEFKDKILKYSISNRLLFNLYTVALIISLYYYYIDFLFLKKNDLNAHFLYFSKNYTFYRNFEVKWWT